MQYVCVYMNLSYISKNQESVSQSDLQIKVLSNWLLRISLCNLIRIYCAALVCFVLWHVFLITHRKNALSLPFVTMTTPVPTETTVIPQTIILSVS